MRIFYAFLIVLGCDAAPADTTNPAGKRVFITSGTFSGTAVTGVCGRAATANHLGGAWTEWLSMTGHDAIDNVTGSGPWRRLDGQVVFADHAGLAGVTTAPLVNIDIDENGSKLVNEAKVWTGTNPLGRVASQNCTNWTDEATWGAIGRSISMPVLWTDATSDACNQEAHVYCFEL